jgi:hypothetical protein
LDIQHTYPQLWLILLEHHLLLQAIELVMAMYPQSMIALRKGVKARLLGKRKTW